MSERYRLPDYEESSESRDSPPQYCISDASSGTQQATLTLDTPSGVFHKGARFDEFAKPSIPPPPPGCPPNHLQQMQMEKGQLNVVITNTNGTNQHHYENHAFEDNDR